MKIKCFLLFVAAIGLIFSVPACDSANEVLEWKSRYDELSRSYGELSSKYESAKEILYREYPALEKKYAEAKIDAKKRYALLEENFKDYRAEAQKRYVALEAKYEGAKIELKMLKEKGHLYMENTKKMLQDD